MPQPSQVVQFQGFAPDMDPTTQGVFTSTDNLFPSTKGFIPMPQLQMLYPALPTTPCTGAFFARYLDKTNKLFAGSPTKLYQGLSGAWVDRSGGQTFTGGNNRWHFAQFGNDTIAVNGTDVPQKVTNAGTNFAPLGGLPPTAKYVASCNNFVFLLNTSVALGTATNQWWCSGIGNDASWTPDIGTQAANAQLSDSDGPIVGAKPLGNVLVVYKLRAVYIFQYVGPPVIWATSLVSAEAGAQSQDAVVDLGDHHIIMGYDDFYTFDAGGPPQPLLSPVRRFLFFNGDFDRVFSDSVIGRYDRQRELVIWHYPSVRANPRGTLDKWVAFHVKNGHWTQGALSIEAHASDELSANPSLTYNDLKTIFSTYDSMKGIPYDSPIFFGSSDVIQGVFTLDHELKTFTGPASAATFTTNAITLDDWNFSFLRQVRPLFSTYPQGGLTQVKMYGVNRLGDPWQQTGTASLSALGSIDTRQSRRFHQLVFNFPSGVDMEVMGVQYDAIPSGVR